MEILEAMRYFGITENQVASLTDKQLKKIYISLIKRNHPDLVYGDDRSEEFSDRTKSINIAYDTLLEFKRNNRWISARAICKEPESIQITLADLIDIRSGKAKRVDLRYNNGDIESIELTSKNLSKYKILIKLEYRVCGEDRVGYVVFNSKDDYSLNTTVEIDCKDSEISVVILDKIINTVLKNRYTELNFKFKHYVMVRINLERIIKNGK